jgi:hypothetical protein
VRFTSMGFYIAVIFLAGVHTALALSTVKLSPATLHPNLTDTETGAGFGDSEAIDVYLNVDTALVVSSATGTFPSAIMVPAGETPGIHYITAIGRKSGDAAQAAFTVSTPWPQYGFGVGGRSWNPWENTISPANVGSLGSLWSSPTDPVYSSPVIANGRVYVALPSGVDSINRRGQFDLCRVECRRRLRGEYGRHETVERPDHHRFQLCLACRGRRRGLYRRHGWHHACAQRRHRRHDVEQCHRR